MKNIKKLILTFQNQKLEQQYQMEKTGSIQKPIFIFIIGIFFISNLVVLGFHFLDHSIETWYLNVAFSILSVLLFIIVIMLKKIHYLQDALTIANIILGFLELNVDPASTNKLEFYTYGNTFMQLQAVLYIVSNFSHAVIQAFSHLILRLALTSILSKRIDFLLVFISIISTFVILASIYYNEKNSRQCFVQNLKENYWLKNTSFIIDQPFIRLNYIKEYLLFNLIGSHKIECFPGYDNYYCEGCNIRKLLRIYMTDKIISVEDQLLKPKIHLPQKFLISYKKRKFLLKICCVDIQTVEYLLILEKINAGNQKGEEIQIQQKNCIQFLSSNNKHIHQIFFNWGAQSLLLLNRRIIKKINLQEMILKLFKIYKIYIFHKISIEFVTQNQNTQIFTFYYQMKIFMMQIFEILSTIQRRNQFQSQIILKRKGCDILIQIINIDLCSFKQQFESNFFLQNLSSLLLNHLEIQDSIQLHFRNYPLKSFAFKT
ncbi:unnamed protein product (macronuclear) [Paramecium tetraurelia]|uniref:Transmembrane protein n=1 Tax=Paramecium tetraurelia TaxID=5888 RepID=A0E8B4_PARTE|nr:uncharacterized protein GSPATT00024259001 [Paramecium tetraurelia]CAK91531.1 unnamed protein product [Paramecium tetraurelia]|eukprot:XP_001458928.1 hypothetical protein (macronuclear) [Paramecium tetraurelia strain d4-2]